VPELPEGHAKAPTRARPEALLADAMHSARSGQCVTSRDAVFRLTESGPAMISKVPGSTT